MGFILLLLTISKKGFDFSLLTVLFKLESEGSHQRSLFEFRYQKNELIMISVLWFKNFQWYLNKKEV